MHVCFVSSIDAFAIALMCVLCVLLVKAAFAAPGMGR